MSAVTEEGFHLNRQPTVRKFHTARTLARLLMRVISPYRQYDSDEYWRSRAKMAGDARALWKSEHYNTLARETQIEVLNTFLIDCEPNPNILDVGCGVGVISKEISLMRPDATIDGIDFPEMIEIAERENAAHNISYISGSAVDYTAGSKQYDFVLSLATLSMIRDLDRLKRAICNTSTMVRPGGIFLMIDPFHTWKVLARGRMSPKEVADLMEDLRFQLVSKGGILFWPFREWLSTSDYDYAKIERWFRYGEHLLRMLGSSFADYGVLAFKKLETDPELTTCSTA